MGLGNVFPDELDIEEALGYLLLNEVVLLNGNRNRKDQPIEFYVSCSSVFAYGCVDSEALPYEEILPLYGLWVKDPPWGPIFWCVSRRKQKPIKPVHDRLVQRGFDVDEVLKP
jgi:hypothetical protein